MPTTTRSDYVRLILLCSFVILFVLFIYTFLHEAGHAIVGFAFGQSLMEFDISFWDFSAHVGIAGGQLTQSQLAIRSAAGAILPLLTWLVFMAYRRSRSSSATARRRSSIACPMLSR